MHFREVKYLWLKRQRHEDAGLGLGRVYLRRPGTRCKCGGMIYELMNERSCGALFLRGYLAVSEPERSSFLSDSERWML